MAKHKKLEERNGVLGKECSKCSEWKSLDEFSAKLGGKRANCKLCERAYRKLNQERVKECGQKRKYTDKDKERRRKWRELNIDRIKEYDKKYYQENKEQVREYYEENKNRYLENSRKWREANKEYDRNYYEDNSERKIEYIRSWRESNRDKVVLTTQLRRARKKELPSDFTHEQRKATLTYFGGCALTSSTDDIHWDHIVPLAIGHCGTVNGNMIPLRSDLNISKNDRNLFEWYYSNKERYNLQQERFDKLIDWLASVNGMTTEEYEAYVYYCHDNPRNDVAQ
jgi:hypothetical protein